MTTPKELAENHFDGFADRDCGEHRTVGAHWAWCYECSQWCYPELPCRGCELPKLKKAFGELAEELRKLAQEAVTEAFKADKDGMKHLSSRYRGAGDAFTQAAQMVEERLNAD